MRGDDSQDIRRKVLYDLLSPLWKRLNGSSHLNETWSPGRQDIIDNEGHTPMTHRLAIFLAWHNIDATNIDAIMLWIVAKANRNDVQVALIVGRRQPAEALTLQILNFCCCESTHFILSPFQLEKNNHHQVNQSRYFLHLPRMHKLVFGNVFTSITVTISALSALAVSIQGL
jgi:hypothetical protein